MRGYTLSNRAAEDLADIYRFSFRRFGEAKVDAYLSSLAECFEMLVERPAMGRCVDDIRQGYLSFQHMSHTVYYQRNEGGIFVVRVLHTRMDAGRHV